MQQQPSLIPLSGVGYMNQQCHSVLSKTNANHSNKYNIFREKNNSL